jgi:hypothetical protein
LRQGIAAEPLLQQLLHSFAGRLLSRCFTRESVETVREDDIHRRVEQAHRGEVDQWRAARSGFGGDALLRCTSAIPPRLGLSKANPHIDRNVQATIVRGTRRLPAILL